MTALVKYGTTQCSDSGQNFKTRVSGSWGKSFFGFWNECDFEQLKLNIS